MSTVVEMSQADYARHRGISPAAVQKAIEVGRIPAAAVRRINRGKLIDVAAADFALGAARFRLNTPALELVESSAAAAMVPSETAGLTKARTAQAELDARLKQFEVDRQQGKLLELEDVQRSMELWSEAVVRELAQLSGRADDAATAFTRGGVPAVRAFLKDLERQIRDQVKENMRLFGKGELADELEPDDEPDPAS